MQEHSLSGRLTLAPDSTLTPEAVLEMIEQDPVVDETEVQLQTTMNGDRQLFVWARSPQDNQRIATWLAKRGATGLLVATPDYDKPVETYALRLQDGKVTESIGTRIVLQFDDGTTHEID